MLSKQEIMTLLLIRNREESILSSYEFPPELIIQCIGGFNADNALQATVEADYRTLSKIINMQPWLMFAQGNARDINGEIISISPLQYALARLDTLAWKFFEAVCKKQTKYQEDFIATVLKAEDVPDMSSLYEAYENYIDLGKKYHNEYFWEERELSRTYKAEAAEFDTLKQSWLAVGMEQRYSLPRHILKDMCHSSPYDIFFNDVILMRAEDRLVCETEEEYIKKKTEIDNLLVQTMMEHDGCPLIMLNDGKYYVFYLSLDNSLVFDNQEFDISGPACHIFSSKSFPFKELEFPKTAWTPEMKTAEENLDNIKTNKHGYYMNGYRGMWKREKKLLFPMNYHTTIFEINTSTDEAKTKRLFPFRKNKGLGYDYALARGFCTQCLGMDDPRGGLGHLYGKVKQDLDDIKSLMKQRLSERKELIERYQYSHESFASPSF